MQIALLVLVFTSIAVIVAVRGKGDLGARRAAISISRMPGFSGHGVKRNVRWEFCNVTTKAIEIVNPETWFVPDYWYSTVLHFVTETL